MEILFWVLLALVFYTYLGYGMILYVSILIKRVFITPSKKDVADGYPTVTLLVAAYNERDYIHKKLMNSLELEYPAEKIRHVWVTDGSTDGSEEKLRLYAGVKVLHQPQRRGKVAAINRAMEHIETPLVIFSDANTLLSGKSVKTIVDCFMNPDVGCVSGEKRIDFAAKADAASAGEGIYWKYESLLKKWDSELHSAVGAAGELFAIRTELFEEVPEDTLLDDFHISLRIAQKGYKIEYAPDAFAVEKASANVHEELKRKIRIAAGGIQSIVRLYQLLNIFRFGVLSFQYISHRVLRWTLAPLALPLLFVLNFFLVGKADIYIALLCAQIVFYILAAVGWVLENNRIRIKSLFVPYFFFIMNYAVYMGFFRFIFGKQSVNWERAKRGA